jgi:hypothetical protein
LDLSKTTNKFEFSQKLKEWAKKIFGTSTTKFLFIEEGHFVEYQSQKK